MCNHVFPSGGRRQTYLILPTLAVVITASLFGCGYQFGVEGPGPAIGRAEVIQPEGPPVRLAIDPLQNRTFERDLEFKYSRYLRQQFIASSGAEVVGTAQEADFLLRGAIESVTLPSLTFTQTQTQESRVSVQVKVEVKDRHTGKVLWIQTANGTAEFFVSATPAAEGGQSGLQFNRILQNRALEQAGKEIAADLSDRFLLAREQGVFTPPSPEKPHGTIVPNQPPTQVESPLEPLSLPTSP